MRKLLLLFLVIALAVMSGCSLMGPDGSQGGNGEPEYYIVRFATNGGGAIDYVKVEDGDYILEPDEPTREGKIFDGWYVDEELTLRWDFDVDVVVEDITLYAKWIDAHRHSYDGGVITLEPTCTENGRILYSCSCGDSYSESILPKGHSYATRIIEPTCTEGGYTLNECEICGYSYQHSPTAMKNHTVIVDVAKAPTCANTGLTEGSHCQDCNAKLVEQSVIPALGHSYEATETEPTCLTDGYITYTCSVCADSYVEDGDSALGHEVVIDEAKAPECWSAGLTEGSHCGRCSAVIVAQSVIPAKGHTQKTLPAVAPDCTNSGLTAGVECSSCGEILVPQNVIAPLGHKSVTITSVPSTCTSTGLTAGEKCSVCGLTLVEQTELEMLPHTPGEEPTCTTSQVCTVCNETLVLALGHTPVEGSYCDEAEYCQVCGEIFEGFEHTMIPASCTEPEQCKNCPYVGTPALGHDYETLVKEPGCTLAGYTYYLCTRCGDNNGNKKDNVVAPIGHDYYDVTVTATCTEDGYTVRKCNNCDYSSVTNRTPALGHAYKTAQVVDPTCTTDGYTVYTCEKCSHSYNDKVVAALKHNYKQVVTKPTCTTDGFTTNTCTRCGYEVIDNLEYAEGHAYVATAVPPTCTAEGYTSYLCSVCGDTDGDKKDNILPANGHSYVTSVIAPTCSEQGCTRYICKECGDSYDTDFTEMIPHSYNGGAYCAECNSPNPDAITITYVLGGAENDPRNVEHFIKGSEITLYDPLSKEGYVFRGWYLDEEFIEQFTSLEGITEDVTLYAKWVRVYHGNYDDGVETPDVPF